MLPKLSPSKKRWLKKQAKQKARKEKNRQVQQKQNFRTFVARCGERMTSTGEVFSNWDMVRKHESHCMKCARLPNEI